MADTILKGLKKMRFLIVGVLALAVLSTPFLTEAGSQKLSRAQIVTASDTVAGLYTEIEVQGDTYEPLELAITKPNGSRIILDTVSDASGEAVITVSDYHLRTAGVYMVEARHAKKNEGYGASKNFTVYPGTVSTGTSSVQLSKSSAKVGATIEMTVTLTDSYENPIKGHVLKVMPSENSVSAYSPQFSTDANGEMNFYITGDKQGIAKLTVYDSSTNKTLSQQPKIAFSGNSGSDYKETGGSSNNYGSYGDYVLLSAEAGPVNSFEISGINPEITAGETLSVTVKAVDEDGLSVTDYTGTVRFSTSDAAATLPNDYTFLAEDQGEHTFSLSIQFQTLGMQSMRVTDTRELTVQKTIEFEVVDEAADYGSDFETEDFEREGDFTLISPASGSYSSDKIEVEGEADYGYSAIIYIDAEEAGRTEVEFDNSFAYTVDNVADGTYELYVDIVELGDGDLGEEEILNIIETSDSETVTIDTTAPEIVSISSSPKVATPGETVTITVLSERDLDEASIIFEGEVYELTQTSTKGKYEAEIIAPNEEGDYTIDVTLMDELGNEAQLKDQLALTVSADGDGSSGSGTTSAEGVGQITGLSITEGEETVILSWETPDSKNSIAYYRIYYGPSSDSLYATSETFDSSTSWSIPGLVGDVNYYFAVSAIDVEGNEGNPSNTVTAVPLSKSSSDGDIPAPIEEDSTITDTGTPEETPASGPASTGLILLSTLGAAGYGAFRKRAIK